VKNLKRMTSTLTQAGRATVVILKLNNEVAILNQMYEDRAYDLVMLKIDPRLDPLRENLRFQDLLRRDGLPQ